MVCPSDTAACGPERFLHDAFVEARTKSPRRQLFSESTDAGSFEEVESVPEDLECLEEGWTDVVSEKLSASETLVFLDWDDSLLPSTWLLHEGLNLNESCVVSNAHRVQLRAMADVAARTVKAAKEYGELVIVTNAESGWVQSTCLKFMPELAPVLEGVPVVSARSTYEPLGVEAPDWKRMAFAHEVATFFEGCPAEHRKNVVSIGDAAFERDALFYATRDLPNSRAKCLKLVECPDVEQLIEQHKVMIMYLQQVVECDRDLDLLVSSPRVNRKGKAQVCSGWICM